jgi:protein O-mannosyl-transferase
MSVAPSALFVTTHPIPASRPGLLTSGPSGLCKGFTIGSIDCYCFSTGGVYEYIYFPPMSKRSKIHEIKKTDTPKQAPHSRRLKAWSIALIAAVAFLVYCNALNGSLIWDDETQIVKNQTIRSVSNIPGAFTSGFWSFYSDNPHLPINYYRPLQTVSYIMAYALGGVSPQPYHALSIGFHILTSILIFLICLELGLPIGAALIGGLLFAVHPAHTEAVAWIAAMPDILCGAFYASSLWAVLRWENTKSRFWIVISAVSFLGALLAKEMAITLPLIVLLILVFYKRLPGKWSAVISIAIPYAIAVATYLLLRGISLGFMMKSQLPVSASPLSWMTLAVDCAVRYLRYAIVPYPLVACHLLPISFADRIGSSVVSILVLIAVLFAVVRIRRSAPNLAVWPIAFFVMLIPVLFLKSISTTAFFAERYLYIPSIAMVIFVASLAACLKWRYLKPALYVAIALFAGLAFARNFDWANTEKLCRATLQHEPGAVMFRNSLASIYLNRGEEGLARSNFESALRYWNDKKFVQLPFMGYMSYLGLGMLSLRAGKHAEAQGYLERALEINPQGDWAQLYLGVISMEGKNNIPEAIQRFERAIQLDPLNETARDYMGIALFNQGRASEAGRFFAEALRINPGYKDAQAHLNMVNKALSH